MNATRYNLVFYQEEILNNFLVSLGNAKGKNITSFKYAYILHDSDIIEATGELKKAHYHLWLEFPQAVKSQFIENILNISGSDASALSYQKTDRNFLAYLTHDTTNSGIKAHYEFENIKTNIDNNTFYEMYYEAVTKANKPSRAVQETENIKALAQIINGNENITSFSVLMKFLLDNQEYELMQYCIKRSYGLQKGFESLFQLNNYNLASKGLENEIIGKLQEARNKYHSLQAQKNKLNGMHNNLEILQDYYEMKEREQKQNEK